MSAPAKNLPPHRDSDMPTETTTIRPIGEHRTSPWFDIRRDDDGNPYMAVSVRGIALLRLVLANKGTAFTHDERRALGLEGILPPAVKTIEQQAERAYAGYADMRTDLGRYQYLRGLQERQEILFYKVLEQHLEEMLPIVYTPTVGEAVQKFHAIYENPRGVSLSPLNIDRAEECLSHYPLEDVRMIVATDSSAILGIGDQGYGGLAIPIGKLALYTVGGGVSPFHSMPVSLDVGTDREDLIDDELYLGVRHKRLLGNDYLAFTDKFVDAVRRKYPHAIIQWEDLSKETAFTVWERYRDQIPSFNDDIQGTGAVALAGVISACMKKGERLRDQTVVIHGAGAGGIGVAWALRNGLVRDGLSEEEAARRVLVLDSKGLLMTDRERTEDYKRPYAQDRALVEGWRFEGNAPGLLETVRESGATVLLGLSGRPGAFDEQTVRAVAANTDRPIIFPLSNPTSSCEALPSDIFAWTDGKALVATGSPFAPVEHGGEQHPIGQGNNAFIFPGLGMGSILARATRITDTMVLEAAYALADHTARTHLAEGRIYPPIQELREVSIEVATAVMQCAFDEGVGTPLQGQDLEAYVHAHFWRPEYLPFVAE